LLDGCIVEQTSEEVEYEGAARMYVAQYLADMAFISAIEGQNVQNLRKPMVYESRITICASDLQFHINKTMQQNLSVRSVAAMLSAIGAKAIRVRGNKIKEQGRWELPLEEFDPSDYSTSDEEGPRDEN
jgi:hypothetical protein